jgi:hypothetical protein
MYESLKANSSIFHLYIFAFDKLTHDILIDLNLVHVSVISLADFETTELKKVKKDRSKAEYCWTCTPSVISYVINRYNVADCTYIDSDLYFYSDPAVLLSELDQHNKNVLITEHRFSWLPRLYGEKRAGRFCVQFITFRNEESSLKILNKWSEQCITWCFSRYEDGKFGDQKYLDEWPSAYPNIHILEHQGGGIAPWNLGRYRFFKNGDSFSGIIKENGSEFNVVFYHFQYVKSHLNGSYDLGWFMIPDSIKNMFYAPYITRIEEIESMLRNMDSNYRTCYSEYQTGNLKNILKTGIKKTIKYNILEKNDGVSSRFGAILLA